MCPSWGAPPWGPETWVMEVVELKEVQQGGLIALVRGMIKVVLLFAGHIACQTAPFCVASSRASLHLRSLARWTSMAVSDNPPL